MTAPERLTVEELAAHLGIGINQCRAGIRAGQLPGQVVGGGFLIYRHWVALFDDGAPGFWTPRFREEAARAVAEAVTQPIPFLRRVDLAKIAS